ncbi:MAG: septum formation initiator family protein [Chloroflexota bacterium]
MENVLKFWQQSWKYILAFAGIIVLILMVGDFNRRTAEARRLDRERDAARAEVTRLSATKQALETRIAYATSDEAVYEWARQQGHMAQPGDRVAVIATPINSTPIPTPTVAVTRQPLANWQVWYALFFDVPVAGQ